MMTSSSLMVAPPKDFGQRPTLKESPVRKSFKKSMCYLLIDEIFGVFYAEVVSAVTAVVKSDLGFQRRRLRCHDSVR